MTQLIYGVRFGCDVCGAEASTPDTYPASGPISYGDMPMPDGWLNLYTMRLSFQDLNGSSIIHLCPACGRLDLVHLTAYVQQRARDEQAKRRDMQAQREARS